MRAVRSLLILIALILASRFSVRAQNASRVETLLGISSRQKPASPLPAPQGLEVHTAAGRIDSEYFEPDHADRLLTNFPDRHEFPNFLQRHQVLNQQLV